MSRLRSVVSKPLGWVSSRAPSELPPKVKRLLADPAFEARVEQFKNTGSAVSLPEAAEVLDVLLNLNTVELKALIESLGVSYRELRGANKLRHGPLRADDVLQIMAGVLRGRCEPLPTRPSEAKRMRAECNAIMSRLKDPADRSALEAKCLVLGDLQSHLEALPRLRGLDRFGVLVSGGISIRLFPYTGDDETKRAQGGLFPRNSMPRAFGSRFVSNTLQPGMGVVAGLFIREKQRETMRRRFDPFMSIPVLESELGGVWNVVQRDSKGERLGYRIVGAPKVSFQYSPLVGRSINIRSPYAFGLVIGERCIGGDMHLTGRLERGVPIPGRKSRLPAGVGLFIYSDQINYLTGPIFSFLAGILDALSTIMNKLFASAEEAVADIADGATVMSGGFGLCRNPENLIAALHKKGVRDLTLISNNCGTTDLGLGILLKSRQIRKIVASYVGAGLGMASGL